MKKVVGKISEQEKLEIFEINGHKTGLEELLLILSKEDDEYQMAVKDLDITTQKYQDWWNTHYSKYKWEKGKEMWKLFFDTNEIVIDE